MNLDTYLGSQNNVGFTKVMAVLQKIADVVDGFESDCVKRLNVSKIVKASNFSDKQTSELLDVIIKYQTIFAKTSKKFKLKKSKSKEQMYLVFDINKNAEKQNPEESETKVESSEKGDQICEVKISVSQAQKINDIVYMFKRINRGKGFDLTVSGSELLDSIKSFRESHPFLFRVNGGNLVYPTDICLELGDLILTYNKASKPLSKFEVKNYYIKVDNCD